MPEADFSVPREVAGSLAAGRWFWDLANWPGVRKADLDGMFGNLHVEGTRGAIARVARFCEARGYPREA